MGPLVVTIDADVSGVLGSVAREIRHDPTAHSRRDPDISPSLTARHPVFARNTEPVLQRAKEASQISGLGFVLAVYATSRISTWSQVSCSPISCQPLATS
jgi:hypothetical protein